MIRPGDTAEDSGELPAGEGGAAPAKAPALRALVVDDSAYNRQVISNMLEAQGDVEVVGRAVDGKQALMAAFDLMPDFITLDLQMPEMDGFAFLRILMAQRPTPVIIVSGYAERENVFRALDLGALDFIAKPGRKIGPELLSIENDLREKIEVVRRLQLSRLKRRAESVAKVRRVTQSFRAVSDVQEVERPIEGRAARTVIGIGSSTGGPPTVQQLLHSLPADLDAAVLIAQHMPRRFTRAFAQRLDRVVELRVVEAEAGQPLVEGVVYVVPGGHELGLEGQRGNLRVGLREVVSADGSVILAPTADHLFTLLAEKFGPRACAIVLTGMGSDGAAGARRIAQAKGTVFAEDPEAAVMPGMPQSTIDTGVVSGCAAVEFLHQNVLGFVDRFLAKGESERG